MKGVAIPVPNGAPSIPEYYREKHRMVRLELNEEGTRRNRKSCKVASCIGKKSEYVCRQCESQFCKDGQGGELKDDRTYDVVRNCFYIHICVAFQSSGEASNEWKLEFEQWFTDSSAFKRIQRDRQSSCNI
jgi:hypothetical protein